MKRYSQTYSDCHMSESPRGDWVRLKDAEAAIKAARTAAFEEAAKAVQTQHSDSTEWDTSYWNQAVHGCVASINVLRHGGKVP